MKDPGPGVFIVDLSTQQQMGSFASLELAEVNTAWK